MRPTSASVVLLFLALPAVADDPPVFKAGKHGPAELKFVSGVPVLTVSGKPAEIGEQIGVLAGKNSPDPMPVLNEFLKDVKLKDSYPALKKVAANLKANFPADHLAEMEGIATASGHELDLLLFVNLVYDVSSGMGCATLIAEKGRSTTGGPLFGRNFDWVPSKGLPERALVLVVRPEGKRAYASVTLSPITGVISGMNDAGLCVTLNEVLLKQSKDKSKFDWNGTPTLSAFRRVLEECKTVGEAEKLLRGMKRMTAACMTICDPDGGAVFEMTPKSLEVRTAVNGVCCCTNHFCTDPLNGDDKKCARLDKLTVTQKADDKLGVGDVFDRLHAVNQGKKTIQAMVFEPKTRTLHLKVGDGKDTATGNKAVKLDKLFE